MPTNPDDTDKRGWGDGFCRGYELATDRFAVAIRHELCMQGFPVRAIEIAIDYAFMRLESMGPKKSVDG
jgi:hypothetical protein